MRLMMNEIPSSSQLLTIQHSKHSALENTVHMEKQGYFSEKLTQDQQG